MGNGKERRRISQVGREKVGGERREIRLDGLLEGKLIDSFLHGLVVSCKRKKKMFENGCLVSMV